MRMPQTLDTSGTVRTPGVRFQHIHLAILNGILHIHQTYYVHLYRDLAGIFFNGIQVFFGNLPAGQEQVAVAGMDVGQFDVP